MYSMHYVKCQYYWPFIFINDAITMHIKWSRHILIPSHGGIFEASLICVYPHKGLDES